MARLQIHTIGQPNRTPCDACTIDRQTPLEKALRDCPLVNGMIYSNTCSRLQAVWADTLTAANVKERYMGCNMLAIEHRGIPSSVKLPYAKVKRYMDNLGQNLSQGNGLILKGPTGTMKTTLAVAVLQEALATGNSGLIITMSSLLDRLFSLKDDPGRSKFEKRLTDSTLLVIDDLGTEYSEGWVQVKLDAIVSERYDRMKSSIYTTNLTDAELKASAGGRYADRIIDRFREVCEVVNFTGNSLRGGG